MASQQAFQKKFEAQLDDWDIKLAQLSALAKMVSAEERCAYENALEELRSNREKAYRRLAEFEELGQNTWDDMKDETEKYCDELAKKIKKISSNFQ